MEILLAAFCGFFIDRLLGDPTWMPHPVIYMGKTINCLEKVLRKLLYRTEKEERLAGTILVICMVLFGYFVPSTVLFLTGLVHPAIRFAIMVIWSWQVLAMRDLKKESLNVYQKLTKSGLPQAREAVARIVGRDTKALSKEGVTKAAVETVAENFSDGVIAPLFWLLIGGVPLAMCYKAINTMDSMLGYKNEKYINFGRTAAKLDDAANYIPARLSALLLILAAGLCRLDMRGAYRIWLRDRRNHASPNSAQTESAAAGALGVQLAGPASYFGEIHDKPYIGDPTRPIDTKDILRVNRMMYVGSDLGLLVFGGLRYLIWWLLL